MCFNKQQMMQDYDSLFYTYVLVYVQAQWILKIAF